MFLEGRSGGFYMMLDNSFLSKDASEILTLPLV